MNRLTSPKKIAKHCLAWALLIIYEVSMLILSGIKAPWYSYVINYTLNLSLFYTTLVLLKKLKNLSRHGVLITVVGILALLTLYTFSSLSTVYLSMPDGQIFGKNFYGGFVRTIYRGIYFVALSWGYYYYVRAVTQEKLASQTKILQLETEQKNKELQIAQLQAQLNPHLLLNALQLLLAELTPTQTNAKQIVKYLSQVFTYAAGRTDENGELPLSLELEQVENYISLQQYLYSFGLHVQVDIQTDDSVKDCRVSPLLLMTFVENFFKYGDLTRVDEPGTITIGCKDRLLELETFNKKRTLPVYSGKLGLQNIKAILQTKYLDNKPQLKITDADGYYQVNLSMKL